MKGRERNFHPKRKRIVVKVTGMTKKRVNMVKGVLLKKH